MQLADLYALVVTEKLAETRDFYVRFFGFTPVFEADWCVYLRSAGEPNFAIMFMRPDHPSRPPGREAHQGQGLVVTLQVADAAAEPPGSLPLAWTSPMASPTSPGASAAF